MVSRKTLFIEPLIDLFFVTRGLGKVSQTTPLAVIGAPPLFTKDPPVATLTLVIDESGVVVRDGGVGTGVVKVI